MATDLEKLVVQLSADIKQYQREMNKAVGVSNQQARQIEGRFRKMNQNLDSIGGSAARSLIAPLGAISAALSVREVARYADAWTGAKNSLAVAGVVGEQQADVLERLYQAAQANAAPVTALADLFGKAAQASDNLGASQQELLKFSGGVATALRVAGTSAGAASGALTQLGQLLGSARVQAEEFNSVNEGARPILIAVAAGLDKAGGSVSKLKKLVNDGEVSGRDFFQAFLRGMPNIEKMAANATTTIDQGLTKVNNAFTKYIGSTDESLGASQRLVAGLSALADNFDAVADVTLKVAGIIAGALVGRSIGAMVAKLGLATTAAVKFVSALRAATTVSGVATAISGLSVAAGPIGLVIGGTAVAALTLYASTSDQAGDATDRFKARMKDLGEQAKTTAQDVQQSAAEQIAAVREAQEHLASLKEEELIAPNVVANAGQQLDGLLEYLREMAGDWEISDETMTSLDDLASRAKTGEVSAGELTAALQNIAHVRPDLTSWLTQFGSLAGAALNAVGAVRALRLEIAAAEGTSSPGQGIRALPEDRAGRFTASDDRQAIRQGQAYVAEAQRRNALSKQALALEDEIAKVRKQSLADGVTLTEQQVKSIAAGNLAAREGRSGSGGSKSDKGPSEYAQEVKRVRDEIAALNREAKLSSEAVLSGTDYETALEVARREAELLEAAQKAGLAVTPQLRAEIQGLAQDYAEAARNTRLATDRQEELQQVQDDIRMAAGEAFGSMVSDVRSFGDALSNLVSRLQTILTNRLFDQLWEKMLPSTGAAGGAGGGLLNAFSSWFGGFRANGGGVQSGRAYIVGEKRPELFVPSQSGVILPTVPSGGRGGGGASVQIIDQRPAGSPEMQVDQRQETGPDGRALVRAIVSEDLSRGKYDKSMRGRYGSRPSTVRRG
ncbi:phage tail protein [Haematobacter missouriensis]|uniref:Phage tail protein n=1 Tax=Haematobacter missouriensis TaxID=366616 RepID=A0A212AHZ0_9RHOB|nr:tape measure protein [Haematobacter missouriensis]OWJ81077.1 phage tail protein [Haematobacter missouriensis]